MEHYNIRQVCLNGHTITETYDISPKRRQKYCSKCGAKTIVACPHCNALIRGRHYWADSDGSVRIFPTPLPEYCHHCGQPYPWVKMTEQNTKKEKEKRTIKMSRKKQEKWFKNPVIIVPAAVTILTAIIVALITGIFDKKSTPTHSIDDSKNTQIIGDHNIVDNRSYKVEFARSNLTYYFSEMKHTKDGEYVRELNLENVGNIPAYNLTIHLGFDRIIQKVEYHFGTGSLLGVEESGASNSNVYSFKIAQLIPGFTIRFICSNDTEFKIIKFSIND